MSNVHVMDHPLIQHKIGIIRREETGSKDFRMMIGEIAMLMCYEATRDLKLQDVEIQTPICKMTAKELAGKKLAVVPILRAGLGMVEGMLAMIPAAKVGHIGLFRDPETLEPVEYYCKLPADCEEREVFVVDPMLATGGSCIAAIQMLKNRGVKNIRFMCIIAAIIETLFKRNYIRKEKKNLIATPTGVELIQIIHEELLKSAELTGIWEKKLREIEKRTYNAGQFLEELKQMVSEIVMSVLSDNSNRHITIQAPVPEKGKGEKAAAASDKPKKEPKKRAPRKSATKKTEQAAAEKQPADALVGQPCPLCGKGTVIKGKTAYGCSEWKSGCTFRKPFE